MATNTTTYSPPEWLIPYQQNWLANVNNLTSQPMQPYSGPTVAPQSGLQQTAQDMGGQFLMNGTPTLNAANGAIQGMASGTYNPYSGATNPYLGANSYVNNVVNQANQDITSAYGRGTSAALDSAAARAGSFGGSGYQEAQQANQRALGDALAASTYQNLNQNYYANMNQASTDANRNAAMTQAGAGLGLQSANQDLASILGVNQLGQQQTAYTQQILDAMKNYYQDTQSEPFMRSDIMGNAISRMGGGGTTTQTTPGGGWSDILGGLLIGGGLLGNLL